MKATSTLNKLCKCPGVDQGTLLIHWCFKPSALPNRLQDRLLYWDIYTHTLTITNIHTHSHTNHHYGHLEQNS